MLSNSKNIYLTELIFGNKLLTAMFFLPIIKPVYVYQISWLSTIFDWLLVYTLLVSAMLIVMHKFAFSKPVIIIGLFYFVLFVSTILNHGDLNSLLASVLRPLLLLIGINYAVKDRSKKVIYVLCFLLEVVIYINFLTIIFYPNGLYVSVTDNSYASENWFMGFKNIHIRTMLPAVTLCCSISYRDKGKQSLRSIALALVVLISSILVKSSTAIVGISIYIVLLFLFQFKCISKIINIRRIIICVILIIIGIRVFNIQNIFEFLITGVFGKDLTLHNRLELWSNSISEIIRHPLLGIGIKPLSYMYQNIGASHSHNYYIYTLLTTGIIGFAIIIYFYISVGSMLMKNKEVKAAKCFQAMIIAFLFMGISESLTSATLLYPMLVMAYDINIFEYQPDAGQVKDTR